MASDLSVAKTASASSVTVGQQVTYNITVTNYGPADATGVELQDNVPGAASLNAITLSPDVGSYSYTGNTVKWEIGSLPANASVTLTVTVTACAAGVLVNTGIVTAAGEDPNPNNNSATATVTVTGVSTPAADLAIFKESCPRIVTAGAAFTYYISAINNGPLASTGVVVTDTLPPGLIPQTAVSSEGTCSIGGNTVTCQIGTMMPNDRAKIAVTVQPAVTGVFENTATIAGDGLVPDPNPGNNTDSTITEIQPAANLSITKTATPSTVFLGDTLTYTITVANQGPSDAETVVVTDTLPAGVAVISAEASQGSGCTPIGLNRYLCNLGTLANGAAAIITIVAKPTEPGCICNTATVESCTPEIATGDNTASICTLVKRPEIDLVVTKTHTPEQVAVCTPVAYTIIVKNKGPFPATGVILTDQLPASFKILSVCASQGQCYGQCENEGKGHDCDQCGHTYVIKEHCRSAYVNEVTCRLGALAAGAEATVHICVRPCCTGKFINTVIATANEEDTSPGDNQANDNITVVTLCEQLDYLLDVVNDLISGDQISPEDAACLLHDLRDARHHVCCGSIGGLECPLGHFISTVHGYITNGIMPVAAGCLLIELAEGVKLGCAPTCPPQGDECCER